MPTDPSPTTATPSPRVDAGRPHPRGPTAVPPPAPTRHVMPFGMFFGLPVEAVPLDYLNWVHETTFDLPVTRPALWAAIERELAGDPNHAFLNSIIRRPADTTTRLVYADWLDEHGGEPEKAAVLRNPDDPAACLAYAGRLATTTKGFEHLATFARLQASDADGGATPRAFSCGRGGGPGSPTGSPS